MRFLLEAVVLALHEMREKALQRAVDVVGGHVGVVVAVGADEPHLLGRHGVFVVAGARADLLVLPRLRAQRGDVDLGGLQRRAALDVQAVGVGVLEPLGQVEVGALDLLDVVGHGLGALGVAVELGREVGRLLPGRREAAPPLRRKADVLDAAGVAHVAVRVAHVLAGRDRQQALGPVRRHPQLVVARVRVADHADLSVRPRLLAGPFDREGPGRAGAGVEDLVFTGRAAGARHVQAHDGIALG